MAPASIMRGDCAPCIFQDVQFEPDNRVAVRAYLGIPLRSRRDVARAHALDFATGPAAIRQRALTQATLWRDGVPRHADAPSIARYNACLQQDGDECALPLTLAPGGVLALQFTHVNTSGFAGGFQSWRVIVPTGWSAPAFGATVRSTLPLQFEGDLVRLPDGSLAYAPGRAGYFVASTASGWAEVARSYRDVEDRRLRESPSALAAVPRATGSGVEAALDQHWLWLRRHLGYRRTYSVVDGGMAPTGLTALLREGEGDCKDQALLLRALLARDGIEARSVWADATPRTDERDTRLPTNRIDHVIVYVPALDRYVDPTLAKRIPIPTGGRVEYPFAVDTGTGQVLALTSEQTR